MRTKNINQGKKEKRRKERVIKKKQNVIDALNII